MANDVNIKINLITRQAEAQVNRFTGTLAKFGGQTRKSAKRVKKLNANFGRTTDIIKGLIGANLFFRLGQQVKDFAVQSIKDIASFEQALVGVARTTDLTGVEFEKLSKEIQRLATVLPTSRDELAKIAQIGGQLGVRGVRNLSKFSETIARLAISTDLTAESAALALTRILNLTQEPIDSIDQLSSAIVDVGNKFAATESEIVTLASEIGRSTAGFGLASEEVVGLAGALKSLGTRAEGGGTAVGRVFREIEKAIDDNSPKLATFANVAGQSIEDFTKLFREDALGAFISFADGANQLDIAGQSIGKTLNSVGLNTDRVNKVLRPVISRVDELKRGLNTASNASRENTASIKESAKAIDTLGSQYDIFLNNIQAKTSKTLKPLGDLFKRELTTINRNIQLDEALKIKPETVSEANAAIEIIKQSLLDVAKLNTTKVARDVLTQDLNARLKAITRFRNDKEELELASNQRSRQNSVLNARAEAQQNATINAGVLASKLARFKAEEAAQIASDTKIKDLKDQARLAEIETNLINSDLDDGVRQLALAKIKDGFLQEAEARQISDAKQAKSALDLARIRAKIAADQEKRATRIAEFERQLEKQRAAEKIESTRSALSTISTLQSSSSKELFAIGKAAAIAQASINGYEAITKAWAIAGPFGGPLAALVSVAVAAQIANIASQKPAGFANGGIVPGGSTSGDNVTARVNSGEMILNRQQQANLFNLANGAGAKTGGQLVEVSVTVPVMIDETEVGRATSRQVAQGLVLGEGGV